jgi:hypothetical protein
MLKRVGFGQMRSFWAAPEFRYATHFIPTDAPSIRAARKLPGFHQGESRLSRALMPLIPAPVVKHFTPGLAFLATKVSCTSRG